MQKVNLLQIMQNINVNTYCFEDIFQNSVNE